MWRWLFDSGARHGPTRIACRCDLARGAKETVMAVNTSIQEFLRSANVPFTVLQHELAYTAQEEAAVTHIPGRDWAKTVVCFADGEPIQAVVSADHVVDLDRLRALAGARALRLAHDDELKSLFPDCERGGMPPFGPLYHQRVFVDAALTSEKDVVFNAGTHTDAICMRYEDFAALTHPIVGQFGERRA
jgi:Ala-tRNA(Pro) deacylase